MNMIFGIIMAISLTLLGFKFANKYFLEKKFYDNLINFVEYLQSNLSFQADNSHTVFQNYTNANNELDKLISIFCNNEKQSGDLKNEIDKISYLTQNDKIQIADFFNNFGRVDKDTQLQQITSMLIWAKQKQSFAYSECLQKGKMYKTLSVMLGLVVLVIYI